MFLQFKNVTDFRSMGSTLTNFAQYMKGTRNATETKGETCGNLYERIGQPFPISKRAFEMRFAKLCGRNYATNRICTIDEIQKMEAAYPPKQEILKRESAPSKAGNTPVANVSPGVSLKKSKPVDWHNIAVRSLFGAGVIGHAVLIWWECSYLWGEGGAIASGIVGLVIVSSVLEIAKRPSGEIAQNLLYLVWLLDLCAWFVHKKALYHSGTTAYGAGIDEYGTGCLAIVICICAGALMYFYRETGLKTDNKK